MLCKQPYHCKCAHLLSAMDTVSPLCLHISTYCGDNKHTDSNYSGTFLWIVDYTVQKVTKDEREVKTRDRQIVQAHWIHVCHFCSNHSMSLLSISPSQSIKTCQEMPDCDLWNVKRKLCPFVFILFMNQALSMFLLSSTVPGHSNSMPASW